jgi:RNA polymerase sigma factor (TIGR02999 family)
MSDITQLLHAAHAGNRAAADRAYTLLYADLRRLARSRLRRSGEITQLDTTALVHESFLRLKGEGGPSFPDRKHFLAYAARAMHTVVVDLVRTTQAERRGGNALHLTLNTDLADAAQQQRDGQAEEVLRVHEALQELAAVEPRLASVVEMRYFAGLSEADIAEALSITERTVQRDWQKAKLLLWRSLNAA